MSEAMAAKRAMRLLPADDLSGDAAMRLRGGDIVIAIFILSGAAGLVYQVV